MVTKENAPGPKAEGAMCLLAGDTSAYSTTARQRKPILSARSGPHEDLIEGIPSDLVDLDVARRACRVAWSWRNAWSIKRAGSRVDTRRISKADADVKLRDLLRQQVRP